MRQYTGAPNEVCAVCSAGGDGRQIAGLTRGALVVWDVGNESPVQLLAREGGVSHARLRASSDGAWLAATADDHLAIWRLVAGAWRGHSHQTVEGLCSARLTGRASLTVASLEAGKSGAVDLVVTSRGLKGASRAEAEVARLSALPSGVRSPEALHAGHWWAADLSPDARWLALSAREKAIHVWDVRAGRHAGTVKLRGTPNAAAFAPDGSRFAVDGGTTVYIHDTESLDLVASWRVPHCYVPYLAWSPDGKWLARADLSTAVRKYNVPGRAEGMALSIGRGRNRSAAFSPDGTTYLVGTALGSVVVWDHDE